MYPPPRLFLVLTLLFGCNSTAERCRDACAWNETCAGAIDSACQRRCEDGYEMASDDCRATFDSFADCVGEAALICSKAETNCEQLLARFTKDCKGQL